MKELCGLPAGIDALVPQIRQLYLSGVYRRKEIAKRLAGQLRVTPAAAADQVDRAVADILRRIRRGEETALPGIGILGPQDEKLRGARRGRNR